jgi:hypothetical protein
MVAEGQAAHVSESDGHAQEVTAQAPAKEQPTLIGTISQIVAFFAGLTAFVYVAGGTVLWIRLFRSELPADPVVTSLPRELVISIGLKDVVLPAAVLAAIAWAALMAVTQAGSVGRGSKRTHGVIALIVGLVAFLVTLWFVPSISWALGWTVAAFAVYFLALLAGWIPKKLGYADPALKQLTPKSAVVLGAVIALFGAFLRIVFEVADPQLDNAVVCVNDRGAPYKGLLVGQAQDTVYLGKRPQRAVIAIPKSRVREMWIGSDEHACP